MSTIADKLLQVNGIKQNIKTAPFLTFSQELGLILELIVGLEPTTSALRMPRSAN